MESGRPPTAAPLAPPAPPRWSEDFYAIQARVTQTGSQGENATDAVGANEALMSLAEAFTAVATRVGTVIIEEQFVADKAARTYKPVNVGGIAGGEKFVEQGILDRKSTRLNSSH